MSYFQVRIYGVPYGGQKSRGNIDAPKVWAQAIIEQTKGLPCVKEGCVVNLTFLLPRNKFPTDFPFGPDLDNLVGLLFDSLNETVFREAKGKDSCVVSLHVTKTKIPSEDEAGAFLEVLPVSIA